MNITKIAVASILTAGLSITTHASTLKPADKSFTTDVCMTAISGSRINLHNKIKNSGLSKAYVANKITCNGENILAFVDKYGKNPDKIVKMLDRSSREVSITDLAQNRIIK